MHDQSAISEDQIKLVQEMLGEAVRHHQAGRLAEAERLYVQILSIDANNADCYHLLGQISYSVGDKNSAITLIKKAVELQSEVSAFHFTLGNVLVSNGCMDEAASCYARVLALEPDHALAHNNLGVYLLTKDIYGEALKHFEKTIELMPSFADAYNNKGRTLVKMGLYREAIESFRHAIEIKPDYAEAHNNVGTALRLLADQEAATGCDAFLIRQRDSEAFAHYEKAIAFAPNLAEAHYNIGILLKEAGRFEEAKKSFEQAIFLNHDYPDAHWNLSLVMLTLGDMENGWREYEWRWRRQGMSHHNFASTPLWDGSNFAGKTLLLHCEQGLGDNIHFIRYAPMVKKRGGQVILACYRPLIRLFRSVKGIDEIFPIDSVLPNYDFQAPLMSLPMIFGTTIEKIPAETPYVFALTDEIKTWADKLAPYKKPRIGLVWSGSANDKIAGARAIYRRRHIRLEQFAPLAEISGVSWFSIQKDDPDEQAKTPPPGMNLINLMNEVTDFADTAALVHNLDMVVGIDTSVIHLAGALAKLTWVLTPFDGCWRYLLNRSDCPWYPNMRVFRQTTPGDWQPVIEEVKKELRKLLY